jgi:hypothetical protein
MKPKEVFTKKVFIPLRAADKDNDTSGTETVSNEEAVPGKRRRPSQITLTPTTNLIQMQKKKGKVRSKVL